MIGNECIKLKIYFSCTEIERQIRELECEVAAVKASHDAEKEQKESYESQLTALTDDRNLLAIQVISTSLQPS